MKLIRVFIEKNQYWLVMYQFGFSYVIKETKSEIQIQKSFMNSQPIVNGSNLSWILAFVTENPHFFFFNRKERGSFYVLWILRYYTIVWIQYKKGRVSFRKGIRENGIQDASTIIIKKKKFRNTPKGECFHLFCIVLAAWPSGKAGDCKSFFPSSNPGVAWSTK